jgi:hypothetical protein
MALNTPTNEQIAQHYKAMMDSVHVIAEAVAANNEESVRIIERNVRHLEMMASNDWWQNYDLTPVIAAIEAGKS